MTVDYNLLKKRRWSAWAKDAAERAIRSGAAGTLAALPLADGPIGIEAFGQWAPWSVGLGAMMIDILVSLAAKRSGAASTARIRG